jgi:TonB family protein
MIPEIILNNLQSWATQVFVIGSIGALLPLVFRVCHPRSQLAYCHLLLAVCLVLPVIQPWQHPIVFGSSAESNTAAVVVTTVTTATSIDEAIPWRQIIGWILLAGFLARLCWTAVGLWIIHRHKGMSTPFYRVPSSIKQACLRTQADALFCVSQSGIGPVTFGFFRPVVLLPASFVSLDAEAQCGIACHELLHVRRRDWLTTVIEEVIAALFWFHPAFWWLVAQARLAREQLVDAEVVSLMSAREPYINALLVMAGARPVLDVAPAPSFLRKRHLFQRMQLLVMEVSMSRFRIVSSYSAIVVILALAGWMVFVSFPLIGWAEVKEPVPAIPAALQNQPGYVVNIQPVRYPAEAVQKQIEGTVAIELTFNAAGQIVDSRVLSGPEELRQTALESALTNRYSINTARTLQVLVDFRRANASLPVPPPPPPPPPPPSAVLLPGAILDSIEIQGLTDSHVALLRQRLGLIEGQPVKNEVKFSDIQSAAIASGIDLALTKISVHQPGANHIALSLGFGRAFGVKGGVTGAVRGFAPAFAIQTPFGPTPPNAGAVETPFGTQLNSTGVNNYLTPVSKVEPVYPPLARQARIQGAVVLQVTVNAQGSVENVKVVTGHPLLIQAAIDAVKNWKYEPQADTVTTIATVNFAF